MLKDITDIIETMLDKKINSDKLYIRRTEYSWVHELEFLTKEYDECIQSIQIVRQNEDGDYLIGIPDYDMTKYLVGGNFNSQDNEQLCDVFMAKFESEVKYKVDRAKEKYERIKSLNMY